MSFWSPVVSPLSNFYDRRIVDPLAKRIAAAIKSTPSASEPEPKRTSSPDRLYAERGSQAWRKLALLYDWISVQQDCWEMYVNDGDIAAAIDGIGLDATMRDNEGFPFRLSSKRVLDNGYAQDQKTKKRLATPAQAALEAVYDRLEKKPQQAGLFGNLATAASRAMLLSRAGIELVWDLDRHEIVGTELVPGIRDGYILRKLQREEDGAFVGWGLFDVLSGDRLREYWPWQIMVFDWNDLTPILMPARLQWRQLNENEQDLYILRKTRAPMRLGFDLTGATPVQVQEFQESYDRAKAEGKIGPESDLAAAGKITVLEGQNTALSRTEDLDYRRKIVQTAARKPKALLAGYGAEAINRDTLREQVKGYIRLLGEVNSMIARPIQSALKLQLVLWGQNPDDFPFELLWTPKDERDFLPSVQAMGLLSQQGLSGSSILEEFGWDWEEESEKRQYESEREDAMRGTGGPGGTDEGQIEAELARRLKARMRGDVPMDQQPAAAGANGNGNGAGGQ